MKKFEVGDIVTSKVEGIGKVTHTYNDGITRIFPLEVTFFKYDKIVIFTETGNYFSHGKPSNYDVKHLSKLEKYLYETEA